MRYRKVCLCLWFAIFLYFFIINSITPLMGEDLVLVVFPQNTTLPPVAEFFSALLTRIYDQMTGWNVRVGEQLSIIFSCFDKTLFNFLNSCMAMLYISLIYQYAFKRTYELNVRDSFAFFSLFSLILLFQPALGEIFFWRTGSTNYLWALSLLLWMSLPLRYYIGYTSIDIIGSSPIKLILLTLGNFFAGFTNENTVIVFLVLYLGCILHHIIKHIHVPAWIYCSGSALLAGFLFLLNAPSTAIRIQTYRRMFGIETVTIKDYLYRSQNIIIRFFSENIFFVILACITILFFACCILSNKKVPFKEKKRQLLENSENFILLLASALSCAALVMSPYIETRAFLLADFFMLVCIIYYLDQAISCCVRFNNIILVSIGCILLIPSIITGQQIYQTYTSYNRFCNMREYSIEFADDNIPFLWGEYRAPYNSRTLTTREDYLTSNEAALNYYYGRKIKCWKNKVWMCFPEKYCSVQMIGNIDTAVYDPTSDVLSVYGWAALETDEIPDDNKYIYLRANNKIHYFRVQEVSRNDVAEYYSNSSYLNCGIYGEISSVSQLFETGISDIYVGILIINDTENVIGQSRIEQEISF